MRVDIGLDLGSTAIKVVFVENEKILWRGQTATVPGQEALAMGLIQKGRHNLALPEEQIGSLVATGYGKNLFAATDRQIDEISANALGLFRLSGGQARTIINIGGQDVKVLTLDEKGRVADFRMNDKCAAGTGRFFELAARLLDTPLEDFGELARRAKNHVELNSTCAVFAESEIISLLAQGVGREEIIWALNASVARRVAGILGRRQSEGAVFLDGGPAQNRGLVEALEDEMLTDIHVTAEPQFSVAYGAVVSLS
ncbi:MAG: acyl-CoA dehydratase activase [Desulfobulbus sp.]|nr:acyl-CoA dehydratase activase [Desulfobulbus sp.]